MIGLLINDREQKELEYVVKREMEELLFDMEDSSFNQAIQRSMTDRYKVLFQLFRRVAGEQEVIKYMPKFKKSNE